METIIVCGLCTEGDEIEGRHEIEKWIKVGDVKHLISEAEINFVKEKLPGLLRKGEGLDLTTQIDHDDFFIVEVMRRNWKVERFCEVRVLSYQGGTLQGGYSDEIDLEDEEEIQKFVDNIFNE